MDENAQNFIRAIATEPTDDEAVFSLANTLLRPAEVAKALAISVSSFYELLKSDDTFPKPISITGGRAVGFIEWEVDEWIAARPRVGRNSTKDLARGVAETDRQTHSPLRSCPQPRKR